MDKESEKLIKNQLKDPVAFKKFKRMVGETKAYETPKSFTGELRPYQKIGYSWLVQNIKYNFGCILADDMGLGKTIQVLSAILYYKENNLLEDKTALIIVPPTLISNWENEIKIKPVKDDISELYALVKEGEKVTIKVETPKKVTAPIKAGMKAGEIKYYISSSIIGKMDLYFFENVDKKTWWRYLVKITKEMLIL